MRVSEIRVNQIRVNQGLGVLCTLYVMALFVSAKTITKSPNFNKCNDFLNEVENW